jgi:hypothetical protein
MSDEEIDISKGFKNQSNDRTQSFDEKLPPQFFNATVEFQQ